MKTLQLRAESLISKFGFGDGDTVEYFINDTYDMDLDFDHHDVLRKLVIKYLIPAIGIPDLTVDFISTIHNPVRCNDDRLTDCSVVVELTLDQVLKEIKP